jgi:formylglycine-generating enzyme required for sulfatase activity
MINNTQFSFIDTIFSSNILETQIEYNPNSIEFFGVQVIDKGFKTSISNNVQPISFEFNEIDNGFYQFGPNDEFINVPESFQLMVSEVNNLQYRSYLSVARELNEIDTTNIGPWILDNEGNILYDLENGYVRWDGDNFYIHNILENLLIPNYPITHVSWLGAKHFAEFFDFRLPHETEWEKAAADNGYFDYPWGNEYDDLDYSPINEIESTYANYFENESHESQPEPYEPGGEINNIGTPGLAPVQFIEDEINPFWFFDKCPEECHSFNHMAGNVWEWVNHDNGYSGSQMCRGGSWRSSKQELRVWSTKLLESHTTGDHIGFRCAK